MLTAKRVAYERTMADTYAPDLSSFLRAWLHHIVAPTAWARFEASVDDVARMTHAWWHRELSLQWQAWQSVRAWFPAVATQALPEPTRTVADDTTLRAMQCDAHGDLHFADWFPRALARTAELVRDANDATQWIAVVRDAGSARVTQLVRTSAGELCDDSGRPARDVRFLQPYRCADEKERALAAARVLAQPVRDAVPAQSLPAWRQASPGQWTCTQAWPLVHALWARDAEQTADARAAWLWCADASDVDDGAVSQLARALPSLAAPAVVVDARLAMATAHAQRQPAQAWALWHAVTTRLCPESVLVRATVSWSAWCAHAARASDALPWVEWAAQPPASAARLLRVAFYVRDTSTWRLQTGTVWAWPVASAVLWIERGDALTALTSAQVVRQWSVRPHDGSAQHAQARLALLRAQNHAPVVARTMMAAWKEVQARAHTGAELERAVLALSADDTLQADAFASSA